LRTLVETRKDCVLFLSSPITKGELYLSDSEKADKCVNFANNDVGSSSYVVIDSGYKRQFDDYNQTFRWIPLNADVAGVCARTDYTFDPWFSPAGLNRGQIRNATGLSFNPGLSYRDRIYPEGVNPVVEIVGEGTILLGDKTAQNKPSAFDRINVRRLFIVLEKAIAAASKFSLFEQNDSFTRQQFRSLVEPFLRDVKARRGIFDFKVVCDETNNTPEMIDRNEFAADIYIKPTRSINYIKLNFIATRSGVNFSEVGA
jgi:phage tail sheath protein FI